MPQHTAEAFWTDGAGHGEIRTETLAEPAAGEVRVRTLYSGISRGTETLVFRGAVPVQERSRMRAPFQSGEFGGAVKYGYSNVGVVEAAGAGGSELIGRPVFCLYPHQTCYVVPVGAVNPLPDGLPPSRAVLAANLETAINAIWDASPAVGDRICVIGGGVVGLLTGWLAASLPGCEVELVDPNPARDGIARQLGMRPVTEGQARADADLVIHASGQPAGLETALRVAGLEATIIEMSWFGTTPVSLALGGAFHSRRLTLRASQVGMISPGQRARWDHARRLRLALKLLADPRLDALITADSDFTELPDRMARLASGDPAVADVLCERIRYDAPST